MTEKQYAKKMSVLNISTENSSSFYVEELLSLMKQTKMKYIKTSSFIDVEELFEYNGARKM